MNGVNKTLYIPLYGKAWVSKKGLFLEDKKAEEIWCAEGFPLKGKAKSKWLAYYMGIRAAVFDEWLCQRMAEKEDALVLHIGCGMDSRALRVNAAGHKWYDVDFPSVIEERKRYYAEGPDYKMLPGDARDGQWLDVIPAGGEAIVVMEGLSMYLSGEELCALAERLCRHFEKLSLLMDCYSIKAAKLSKYKNPINTVGVTQVYGMDEPRLLEKGGLLFLKEHEMTPEKYIARLSGGERKIFKKLYAGKLSKSLYRLYEYKKA